MRTLLLVSMSFWICLLGVANPARAQSGSREREREILDLQFKLFRHVEFPLRIRRLETDIKIAKAEAASLKRHVKKYNHSNATAERARLELLRAESRLKTLRYERALLLKYRQSEKRLRELLLQRSAALGGRF